MNSNDTTAAPAADRRPRLTEAERLERMRASRRRRALRNRDKRAAATREYNRRWRAANRDKVRRARRAWKRRNRARVNAAHAEYRRRNRDKFRAYWQAYQARQKAAAPAVAPAATDGGLVAALHGNKLYSAASAAVPRRFPRDVRDDVISSLVLAVLERQITVAEIPAKAASFITAHYRDRDFHKAVSIDAFAFDFIAADAGRLWSEPAQIAA